MLARKDRGYWEMRNGGEEIRRVVHGLVKFCGCTPLKCHSMRRSAGVGKADRILSVSSE